MKNVPIDTSIGEIRACFDLEDHLSVVVVERNTEKEEKWVVWYYNHQTKGFVNGFYTNSEVDAIGEMFRRLQRRVV